MSQSKKSPITFEQEELLWEKKHFNLDSSTGLIHAVIFYLIKCFGVWQGKYLKMLTTEHVKFGEDEQGKYISIDTKSILGVGKVIKRYDDPGNPRSVYKIFKIYQGYLANEGPFLLRPITSIKDYVCYSPWALGVGIINQTVRNLMMEIGDGQPYANSSISLFALDMLKGTGIGYHCIGTWTQHLCISHTKSYLSDIFDSCSTMNCEDKNKELCLLVSRMLDPPYPCSSLVEERIKVARELKKNKINAYDSWLENISTKCSGDEEAIFQNLEELSDKVTVKRTSNGSSKVQSNSQLCSPFNNKRQHADATIKSEILDLETDLVEEDLDNNVALSHDSWLKNINTDENDEDVIYQKTEELSEKETCASSSSKVSELFKSQPPTKKIKNSIVKRASADVCLTLNPSTSQNNMTTPKNKDSNSTHVKITSVSSISESAFSLQVDGGGINLNKLSNSKKKFKVQNVKTRKVQEAGKVTKPNLTWRDQCSVKTEDTEDCLPLTFIKEEITETSDCENFECETSPDSYLENLSAPGELSDAPGNETQANEIITDVPHPTDSLHLPTSPRKGLLSKPATKSFSSQHSPDPSLDSFQMLKTIIKQENEDDYHCEVTYDSPSTSSGGDPLGKDSPLELDISGAHSEHSFSCSLNGNLNLAPSQLSPQSDCEEASRDITTKTQSDTAKDKNLVHLENIPCTPDAGSEALFDSSKNSCFEKSLTNLNGRSKTKKLRSLVQPLSMERGSSKINNIVKYSTCECLHTCNISEKPEHPPNFLSCLRKSRQHKESSCHSSFPEDSSKLPGSLCKSSMAKSNEETIAQENATNALKRSISDLSSQTNAETGKTSKSKTASQTRSSLKRISEFSKTKSKLFWRYRQKRLRSVKKKTTPPGPPQSSSSPFWPFSSSTLVNSMGAHLKPSSGIYHFRSDRHEHAAYQTLQIKKEKRSQMFLIGDISLDNYTKRDDPNEQSTIGVTTSEISIGDYFPKGTVIPASGLKLFTKYGPDGLEVILKFDFSDNNNGSTT